MYQNRFPSFFFSLCLHLGLLALVLWSPVTSSLPDLSQSPPLIAGMVTIGAPGKKTPGAEEKIPEPAKGTDEAPQPITAPPPPQEPPAPQPPKAEPPPPVPPVPPEPVKTTPEPPAEDAVPIPKEPETPPKEEPKKEEPKPREEPKKEEPKPKEELKKEEPKKEEPKKPDKPADKKPPDKPGRSSVDDALSDRARQTGTPSGGKKGRGSAKTGRDKEHSSADDALAALARQVGGAGDDASGRGPGGSGGHGMGRRGSYEQSIIASVRPNWTAVKRADRKNLSTSVRIRIARDGIIEGAIIVSPSGDKAFDDMIMFAIRKTRQLEPPQSPDQQDVVIRFTP